MTLEQQVCNEDLAIKLKTLGVPQKSLYSWVKDNLGQITQVLMKPTGTATWGTIIASAFTTAELGELLPECYLTQRRLNGQWECWQDSTRILEGTIPLDKSFPRDYVSIFAKTETEARAKMLVHLIENSLIKL